jgi:RNA polymerase sigma-70 factor, ECF subfamily
LRMVEVEIALQWNLLAVMREDTQPAALDIDVELMLGFQAGDLQAFEKLFSRHARSVVNFAYRFVRNREVAEELAQEIFLKVHDAAPEYRPEAKFTTWLFRIATNVCLNEIRRPYFKATHHSPDTTVTDDRERPVELEDTERPGPQAAMERRAVAAALKDALERLPEKQRLAFILNKYQDLSYAEVALVMKISEQAVKSLIHRAKEAMAERLRPLSEELL